MEKREPHVVGGLTLDVHRETEFWILCGRGEIELILTLGGFEARDFWLDKLFRFIKSFRGAIHGFIVEFSREKERSKVILRISAVASEGDLTKAKVIDIERWLTDMSCSKTGAELASGGSWVISFSDLRDHYAYYTPAEIARFLEGYDYEGREFWMRAVSRFQEAMGERVFGYIVDFTYDGDIDRIVAVIADCERREITLADIGKWAEQQGLE